MILTYFVLLFLLFVILLVGGILGYVFRQQVKICFFLQCVNFINILRTNFLYKHHLGSFFNVHVTREKLLKQCSYKKLHVKC
jgi:hypothetical protein